MSDQVKKPGAQFYNSLFQNNIPGQAVITYYIFPFPVGNAKETGNLAW